MRARGLKHEINLRDVRQVRVAPHAGAWIETPSAPSLFPTRLVAPHAGAWIETQMCLMNLLFNSVAPHAGAWIET